MGAAPARRAARRVPRLVQRADRDAPERRCIFRHFCGGHADGERRGGSDRDRRRGVERREVFDEAKSSAAHPARHGVLGVRRRHAPRCCQKKIALLLASGIAVILPNYRGSLGYGVEASLGHNYIGP